MSQLVFPRAITFTFGFHRLKNDLRSSPGQNYYTADDRFCFFESVFGFSEAQALRFSRHQISWVSD